MKRLLLLLSAWLFLTGATFNDNFNRSDGELGASWDSGYSPDSTSLSIVSQKVQPSNVDLFATESVNSFSPANNQYSQIKIDSLTTDTNLLPRVYAMTRMAAPSTFTMYACIAFRHEPGATTQLVQFVSGTGTELAVETTTTWANGDVLKTTSNGTTHKCFQNTGEILSSTDNAIASGRVGFAALMQGSGASVSDIVLDDFEGGDLAGAPATKVRRRDIQWR